MVGVAVLLLGLAAITFPAGSATGATGAFNAVGTARCTVAGKLRFKPALRSEARPNVTLKLVADLACSTGTTGHAGVTVTSGHMVATGAAATRSCASPGSSAVNAVIKWRAAGGNLIDTRVGWLGGSSTGGPPLVLQLPGTLSGSSGSFAGARSTG